LRFVQYIVLTDVDIFNSHVRPYNLI